MAEPLQSVEVAFETVFVNAMRGQPQIQYIVLASEHGLVIASQSRNGGKEHRLAALAPVLNDAGETVFNEFGLAPLGELILHGSEGTAYQVRLKSSPGFLLIGAKGQVNIGLLRLIAGQVETESSRILAKLMQ